MRCALTVGGRVMTEGGALVRGLRDLRIVDFSIGIAGPYASKLLADAGADVIRVESPAGDPLRRWSASGARIDAEEDGAFFQFLNCSKRSVVAEAVSDAEVAGLIADADLVIADRSVLAEGSGDLQPAELRARHPGLVVLSPW